MRSRPNGCLGPDERSGRKLPSQAVRTGLGMGGSDDLINHMITAVRSPISRSGLPCTGLQIELPVGLDRDKTHGRPAHRLGDRLCVVKSFSWLFRYGLMNFGAISRTSGKARAKCWELGQASMPTRH